MLPLSSSRTGQGGIGKQVLLAVGQFLAPDPLVSSAMPVLSALRKVCRAGRLVKPSTYGWLMDLKAASIVFSPLDIRSMGMLAWMHNTSWSYYGTAKVQ